MSAPYLNPKHAFSAHEGFQPVKAQLAACSAFLSSSIAGMDATKLPYTVESYRCILKCYAISLDALEKLLGQLVEIDPDLKALTANADAPATPEVAEALSETEIEAKVETIDQLTGFVEFAILRTGQLVNPMELHRLPVGTPGQKDFEEVYKPRSQLYRCVDLFIDTLQKTHQFLGSPVHRLDMPEDERGKKFREAKKNYLLAEIQRVNSEIAEAEEFVTEAKAMVSKLNNELATVDQTELFTFPSGSESMLTGNSEPSASI